MGTEQMQQAIEASLIDVKTHQETFRQENLDALRPFCSDESVAAFSLNFLLIRKLK